MDQPQHQQTYSPRQKAQRALTMTFGAMALMKCAAEAEPDDHFLQARIDKIRTELQDLEKELLESVRAARRA